MLERRHRRRGPDVILAAQAELILAADVERVAVNRRVAECIAVAPHRFFRDLEKPDTFDSGRGAGKIFGDKVGL